MQLILPGIRKARLAASAVHAVRRRATPRIVSILAWSAGALGAAALVAPVASAGVDSQNVESRVEYFADSDDVHVTSLIGQYLLDLTEKVSVVIGWNRERVVIPGIAAPPGSEEAVDSISGASRPVSPTADPFSDYTKIRNQLDSSVSWRGASVGYYRSSETDYFAQQVSSGWQRRFFDDLTMISVGGAYGWDDIAPLADDDTATAPDRRTTRHASLVATQTLSPTTVAQLGVDWNGVRGLQHNPYRNVYVAGAYLPELHPDSRTRRDLFVKVNQYLANRSSLKASYKYYTDDWGVASHTIGGKLNQYVSDDVVVRYRYRYYRQAGADFFRDEYTTAGGVDGLRTGDYRLGDFSAHLFGTKLSWDLGRGPLKIPALDGIRVNIKYERYFNSNNFSANIFESGLSLSF